MIKLPSKQTLKRYGLSEEEWRNILESQGWVCCICEKEPPSGRLCVDHEHVKGWKKMPPEAKKRHVRGILCWTCNYYYVGRGITLNKAQNVVTYLKRYMEKNGK